MFIRAAVRTWNLTPPKFVYRETWTHCKADQVFNRNFLHTQVMVSPTPAWLGHHNLVCPTRIWGRHLWHFNTLSLSRVVSVTNTYHIYSKVKLSLYRHAGDKGKRSCSSYTLYPGKGPPVPTVQEAGWTSELVLCVCRGSNPGHPVCSQTLHCLSYPISLHIYV
jgi:hypothetical protein